jgi:hypothetical protein
MIDPAISQKLLGSGDLQLRTKIFGFPFCSTCSQVPFRNWSHPLERWHRTEARAACSHEAVSTKVSMSLVIRSSLRLACISSVQSNFDQVLSPSRCDSVHKHSYPGWCCTPDVTPYPMQTPRCYDPLQQRLLDYLFPPYLLGMPLPLPRKARCGAPRGIGGPAPGC